MNFCERPRGIKLRLFLVLRNRSIFIVKHLRKVKDEAQPLTQPHFYPFGTFFHFSWHKCVHILALIFVCFFNEENWTMLYIVFNNLLFQCVFIF